MKIQTTAEALALGLIACTQAYAQSGKYPDKPIRLVAPFPPGGTVDVVGRLVAPIAATAIGQQIVLENRVGASGIIGTGYVAQSKPDGYTLLINTTPLVTNTLMYSKVPYNVLTDFSPVSNLASTPSFVSVHPSVPTRSVKELIALAEARPGTLNYGGAGTGTNPHIAGRLPPPLSDPPRCSYTVIPSPRQGFPEHRLTRTKRNLSTPLPPECSSAGDSARHEVCCVGPTHWGTNEATPGGTPHPMGCLEVVMAKLRILALTYKTFPVALSAVCEAAVDALKRMGLRVLSERIRGRRGERHHPAAPVGGANSTSNWRHRE